MLTPRRAKYRKQFRKEGVSRSAAIAYLSGQLVSKAKELVG